MISQIPISYLNTKVCLLNCLLSKQNNRVIFCKNVILVIISQKDE